jgi:threonine dehydrogenase-like Zn-dependent dehydrogenase
MRHLVYEGKGRLAWREAPDPELRTPRGALVRPFAAARCDLDELFLRHRIPAAARLASALGIIDPLFVQTFGRSPFAAPFPYGHECVAQVVRVGEETRNVRVGDVVVVPFQISCGGCAPCGRGLTAHCTTDRTGPVSTYGFGDPAGGWGGAVSDQLYVPHADAMLLPVPPGIDPRSLASASDNLPDGYRTVARHLAATPGAPVLVVGGAAKSVGLYAAACAVALGSSSVDYVDGNRGRLEIAARVGANPIDGASHPGLWKRQGTLRRDGYPITVDASGSTRGLSLAIRSLAVGGVCTTVAFYVRNGTPVPLWRMYLSGSSLVTGLVNARADLPGVLALVASGKLDPGLVTTLLAPWDDARRALLERTTKVVLWREPAEVAGQGRSTNR